MSCMIVDGCTRLVVNSMLYSAAMRQACPRTARTWGVLTEVGAPVLAAQIGELNRRAYCARYKDASMEALAPYQHSFRGSEVGGLVATYRALQCLLYQCTEGACDTDPLYQELQTMAHELAHAIVCDLPEYQRAPWSRD